MSEVLEVETFVGSLLTEQKNVVQKLYQLDSHISGKSQNTNRRLRKPIIRS